MAIHLAATPVRYLAFIVILLSAQTGRLQAQVPSESDWGNLRRLNTGQEIQIVLVNLQSHRGKFADVSDQAISLSSKGKTNEMAYAREQVLRVAMLDSAKRKRNTLIGLGIGAAAGAVSGGLIGSYFANEANPRAAAGVALIFGGGAAAAGAAIGHTGGYQIVYRAQLPPK